MNIKQHVHVHYQCKHKHHPNDLTDKGPDDHIIMGPGGEEKGWRGGGGGVPVYRVYGTAAHTQGGRGFCNTTLNLNCIHECTSS